MPRQGTTLPHGAATLAGLFPERRASMSVQTVHTIPPPVAPEPTIQQLAEDIRKATDRQFHWTLYAMWMLSGTNGLMNALVAGLKELKPEDLGGAHGSMLETYRACRAVMEQIDKLYEDKPGGVS
jgi:hypothetical protein